MSQMNDPSLTSSKTTLNYVIKDETPTMPNNTSSSIFSNELYLSKGPYNKKFYVVAKGRKPGIYATWDECEAQVKGLKGGGIFKKLKDKLEAEEFLEKNRDKEIPLKVLKKISAFLFFTKFFLYISQLQRARMFKKV